jgi:tRNA G37 N-methylase TrmD
MARHYKESGHAKAKSHTPHHVAHSVTQHKTKHVSHSAHHAGHEGMYEGVEQRRKQEHEDSMLFSGEHHMYMANLPTEVIFKTVSRPYSGMPENLDDTMKGVDHQVGTDMGQFHKHLHPKKV